MAGWRLHAETAKKRRTARSTTAVAPTPAFVIERCIASSRTPSAREPYHLAARTVNTTRAFRLLGSAQRGQRLDRRPGGGVEIGLGVREGHEGGLELRGRQVDAALEHGREEARVARGVGLPGGGVVG